jgi:hypothetical protein
MVSIVVVWLHPPALSMVIVEAAKGVVGSTWRFADPLPVMVVIVPFLVKPVPLIVID